MDIKIIIWIILGLIYLFARNKKKKDSAPPPYRKPEPEAEQAPSESSRPQTFEELLREIEGMKGPSTAPPPATFDLPPAQLEKEKELTTYDYETREKKPVEDTYYNYRDHDRIYEVYEDAKKQAFLRPSLEESLKLSETIVRFDSFKRYKTEIKSSEGSEFLKELREPSSFRKAFIMSEILKRKF